MEEVFFRTPGVKTLEFDPTKISFEKLIEVFWNCHNPCQVGGQGPDQGTQYRSGIYTYNEEQQAIAIAAKKQKSSFYENPIGTEIQRATQFYLAEEYHQKYIQKNRGASCSHL